MQLDKTKLFGILHDPASGQAIQRQVRITKVGFGMPSGPDVHAFIDPKGKWTVEVGVYDGERGKRRPDVKKFENRTEAEAAYNLARRSAADRKYPRKFNYFVFLKMRSDGNYWHDFDAIEQHGPVPSEIDVVFLANEPFEFGMQWYTKAELKCHGDGENALRRNELAETPDEKKLAQLAVSRGEKFFEIEAGCYSHGCSYAKGQGDKAPLCKPHGRLFFQLLNSPRIGGTCSFDTTGFRSIQQLYSCIQQIKAMTGRGDVSAGMVQGIPLKLVLRPYKTSHNGTPSIQYGVALELRAKTPVELMRLLHGYADEFREAARLGEPAKQITAPAPVEPEDEAPANPDADAPAMAAEFYPEDGPDGPDAEDDQPYETGEYEDAEPVPTPEIQMPQRASEAARAPVDAERQAFLSLPIAARILKFGELKNRLVRACGGSGGEAEYHRLLKEIGGVEKSNQFKTAEDTWQTYAKLCAMVANIEESLKREAPAEEYQGTF